MNYYLLLLLPPSLAWFIVHTHHAHDFSLGNVSTCSVLARRASTGKANRSQIQLPVDYHTKWICRLPCNTVEFSSVHTCVPRAKMDRKLKVTQKAVKASDNFIMIEIPDVTLIKKAQRFFWSIGSRFNLHVIIVWLPLIIPTFFSFFIQRFSLRLTFSLILSNSISRRNVDSQKIEQVMTYGTKRESWRPWIYDDESFSRSE